MKKPFKQLRGNRVYLNVPAREESKVIVDENTKEALDEAFRKRMTRLEVYAVGDLVTDLKSGDTVLVDPAALQKSPLIPLTDELSVLLVSPFDIVHIW